MKTSLLENKKTARAGFYGFIFLLIGCSQLENPQMAQESCDLCHNKSLSQQKVHLIHLSELKMQNFPNKNPHGIPTIDSLVTKLDTSLDSTQIVQYRLLNYNYSCTDCHLGADSIGMRFKSAYHLNGRTDAIFNAKYLNEKFDTEDLPTYQNETCDNMPCHGAGKKGKIGVSWSKSVSIDQKLDCNACHNLKNHKPGVRCNLCHLDVTNDGKTINNFALHINGITDTLETWAHEIEKE